MSEYYTCYMDDAEFNGSPKSSLQDVFLIGGWICSKSVERKIFSEIDSILNPYVKGSIELPIKWNLKDLRDHYNTENKPEVFKNVLNNNNNIRKEIKEVLLNNKITIIISAIQALGTSKDTIEKNKLQLYNFAFSNCLNKIRQVSIDNKAVNFEISLDWPSRNDTFPYTDAYKKAYYYGKDSGGNFEFQELSSSNFNDTVSFRKTEYSRALQIADMIIGSSREFFKSILHEADNPSENLFIKHLLPKFKGYPDQVFGTGIILSPASSRFRRTLEKYITKEYIPQLPPPPDNFPL